MKKISIWAKKNRKISWILITIIQITVYLFAIATGALLDQLGIHLTKTFLLLSTIVVIICLLIYPIYRSSQKSYIAKKSIEIIVGFAVFCCICFLYNTNNRFYALHTYNNLQGSFPISKTTISKDSNNSTFHYLTKKEIRQEKKNLRSMFFKKDYTKDSNGGSKSLLAILIVLGAIFGIFAVASLGCAISCGGAEALGIIVAILGIAGIVWLTKIGLSNVSRKKESPRKETEQTEK